MRVYVCVCVTMHVCMQGVVSGVMRATGRQATNAIVNFSCYYIVGIPLGITLALVVGLEVKGVWIGLTVADGLQVFDNGKCTDVTTIV